MKSKTITHIILEGIDGVGKDTICDNLWRKYDFKQRVYIRGELSDYAYAKAYNRPFIATQRGLPFLYVLLTCDEDELKQRLECRDGIESEDIKKIQFQRYFIEAAKQFKDDYHVICIDTSSKTVDKVVKEVYSKTVAYINSLPADESINPFNVMYSRGCKKLGIKFAVKNNQPFFDDDMVMADAQLHNGKYETMTDLTCPHNLIFSLGYDMTPITRKKTVDIAYPINSKILVRHEVHDYFNAMSAAGLTIMTTKSEYTSMHSNLVLFDKCFGKDYIEQISQARATIYIARDLAYLGLITVRPYEAVLANQILFVDVQSDPQCNILKDIYGDDMSMIRLLYVDEDTFVNNYRRIIADKQLVEKILTKQTAWYAERVRKVYEHFSKI